jgi:hypothetical protein
MAKNVLSMGEHKFRHSLVGKTPKERDNLEDLHLDRRIILKWILNKYAGRTWTGLVNPLTGIWSGRFRTR